MSRSLVHFLLSLLLLASQQLSLGHGYTHWSEVSEGIVLQATKDEGNGDGKVPKPALHDLCGQCAASAQIAFALPTPVRRFVPAELAYATPIIVAPVGICRLTVCAFQPRGPPRVG